jgi:hypothetical protein
VIQAAQDFTTHGGHIFQLRQAFWHLDVVPQIDEMVRQRIPAAAYERYLTDPERPAFLQLLREHEIGGRAIEDVLDSITAEPLDGLRSIAAGLHGRAGKEPAPARGMTTGWAERTPAQASAEIQSADQMADQRQAELGRQIASQPPEWAVRAWGRPPAEPGALQDDWQRRAGLVGYYREVTGITDPAQAIGPVPSAQPDVAEMFHASVRALQLPDEAALLKAMGQGELEAAVDEHDRAIALAPADVQPEIDQRQAEWEDAQISAHIAGGAQDAEAQAGAKARARDAAADLSRLAVADAARREWTEAHTGQSARAEAAERELRARGLAERIPVTDAEVATASAEPRESPAIDPEAWAQMKAEQTAQVDAERQGRAEAAAQLTPVTDAELARYGVQQPAPELEAEAESAHHDQVSGAERPFLERDQRTAEMAEIHQRTEEIQEAVRRIPDREAERAAEIDAAGENEPVVHEPQAEPELEPSWQQGDAGADYEPRALAPEPAAEIEGAELELEI